jgi:hypothetical protein
MTIPDAEVLINRRSGELWNFTSNIKMEETTSKIKFLQWNCQSIKSKLPELQHTANQYDIIFLNETWLTKEDTVYIKGLDIIRKDTTAMAMLSSSRMD